MPCVSVTIWPTADVQTQADLRVCFDNLTEEQRKRQGLDTQKPLEPDQLRSLAQEYAQQVLRRSPSDYKRSLARL